MITKKLIFAFVITAFFSPSMASNESISLNTNDSYVFGKSASFETRFLAHELMNRLDPHRELTVIHMNKFFRYWLGQQNAIALPFLNYLLVNEEWLSKLPSDAQRFVIGRTLITLIRANEALAHTLILPLLIQLTGMNFSLVVPLLLAYASRKFEFDCDRRAGLEFDCIVGGQIALAHTEKFDHDGTALGGISSTVNLASLFLPLFKLKSSIPGKFTNRTSRFGTFWRNLPVISWFSSTPKTSDRIKALRDLELEKV